MNSIINKDTYSKSLISKICCVIIIFLSTSIYAQEGFEQKAQAKNSADLFFDGFYLGTSIGVQNIFGGAFIDDLDLLGQKSGFVFELATGYRRQFSNNRLLLGLEVQLGFTDGDLVELDERYQLDVFYKSKIQSGFGLIAGVTVGSKKNFLIYSYGNLTNRNFDIEFMDITGNVLNQEDGQGFLRYGLGVEFHIKKRFNSRISFGGVNVDFGNLKTSQDVEDMLDINVGLVYQF